MEAQLLTDRRSSAMSQTWRWPVSLVGAFLICLSGCARGRVIQATQMPASLAAAPLENSQILDMSRLASEPVSSELIERGDVVEVTIETGYTGEKDHGNNATRTRVGDDGAIVVPIVGPVTIAGMEPPAAEQAIANASIERGVYRQPQVTVMMHQQRTSRVTVLGAVEKPGTYELPRTHCSLLSAIVEAGGLAKEAGTVIEVRHGASNSRPGSRANDHERTASGGGHALTSYEPQSGPALSASSIGADSRNVTGQSPGADSTSQTGGTVRIDLVSVARQGRLEHAIRDGDVIMVEKRDFQPIQVLGLVTKPGVFEMPANKNVHVLDAVALAGGVSTPWADKIHLIRTAPGGGEPAVIEISMREAKNQGQGNLLMAPGDTLSVEMTPTTVFMDTVKQFAHFTFGASVPIFR